jgi:hypothetical protein
MEKEITRERKTEKCTVVCDGKINKLLIYKKTKISCAVTKGESKKCRDTTSELIKEVKRELEQK